MKLIISNQRIVGTATDDYSGPNEFVIAPPDFDESLLAKYLVEDGVLVFAVPTSITARQARLILLARGLLAKVPLAIAQLPSPQKEAAQIEWEYATDFERSSPLLMGLGAALGWPPETLDEMFIEGAKL